MGQQLDLFSSASAGGAEPQLPWMVTVGLELHHPATGARCRIIALDGSDVLVDYAGGVSARLSAATLRDWLPVRYSRPPLKP